MKTWNEIINFLHTEAMERASHADCHAYLIDLNPDSFEFGRQLAAAKGLADRVQYIQGDVAHYHQLCDAEPHVVELVGICEYLPDNVIGRIAEALGRVMPPGCHLVSNSLSRRHGTDRFFKRVFDLHMIHRTPQRISRMLADAGIQTRHVVREPLGVYDVLICQKT